MTRQSTTADAPTLAPWLVAAQALVALVALGPRIYAAFDAFWFDEVWSLLAFARNCRSPADVFRFAHDNNHHLVTCWMYICGSQEQWFVYRVPSLLAGCATVPLVALVARRFGAWESLSATILAAASSLLITYSSEARGYALAGFFSLAAWLALARYQARGGWPACVGFAAAVAGGLLSHVTFVFFYAGTLAWSLVVATRQHTMWPRTLTDLARCHAMPLACVAALYVVHIRKMAIGGGPAAEILEVVAQTLALAGGRMDIGPLGLAAAALGLGLGSWGLLLVARRDRAWAAFFAVTIFLAPAVVVLVRRPEQLYPRYFFLPSLWLFIPMAVALGRLRSAGRAGALAAASLLSVIVLANAGLLRDFLRDGRGQYLAALEYLIDHTAPGPITLQSDHDYETVRMLAFYYPYLPKGTPLRYVPQSAPAGVPPQWAIMWRREHPPAPPPTMNDSEGRPYVLECVFPYAGLSGYHWAVYRSKYRVGL